MSIDWAETDQTAGPPKLGEMWHAHEKDNKQIEIKMRFLLLAMKYSAFNRFLCCPDSICEFSLLSRPRFNSWYVYQCISWISISVCVHGAHWIWKMILTFIVEREQGQYVKSNGITWKNINEISSVFSFLSDSVRGMSLTRWRWNNAKGKVLHRIVVPTHRVPSCPERFTRFFSAMRANGKEKTEEN